MDYFMNLVEELIAKEPGITLDYIRSLRISSDHCTFYPRQDQIPRMVKLGMIVSCGGREIDRASPWLQVYGPVNANRIAPVRSMLDGGLMTVAEGEFQVETGKGETVFAQFMPLITRKDSHGNSIAPEQAIDQVSLIKMSTVWASHFVLKEQDIGTIEPGKFADLIVLNKDYFSTPEAELPGVYPLMTVVGGKPIVIRKEYSAEVGLPATGPQMEFIY
jgi:predicted amidohydrolase YtcJ